MTFSPKAYWFWKLGCYINDSDCHLLNDSDDGITKDIIFCCLIICSIDFLIQPTDLNVVFWLVYKILNKYNTSVLCQKVFWQIMPEEYNLYKHNFWRPQRTVVLWLRRGLTIVNKRSDSNSIPNIQSSNSKFLDCISTIP